MSHEQKHRVILIVSAAVLLGVIAVVETIFTFPLIVSCALYAVPYFIVGFGVIQEVAEDLCHGEIFHEELLMSLATLGAFGIGFLPNAEPEFLEAVFVMLFFRIGELFEQLASDRSRRAIGELMDLRPETATVEREGKALVLPPETVDVGEVLLVRVGERVPLDGVIIDGSSAVDTVALTGESLPRSVVTGDTVLAGFVNLSGVLRVKVTKPYTESTASKILELVENAGEHKSKNEKFITKFARYYTPAVVIGAMVLALIPPLVSGAFVTEFPIWLKRALTFLVVSCPCALVISVPLTFFAGIGRASRQGILIKGSQYIEALAKAGSIAFDKTGTLTEGVFQVTEVRPVGMTEEQLLHLVAQVEQQSNHPIAVSLREADTSGRKYHVSDVREVAGQGLAAIVDGVAICVGNTRMMQTLGIICTPVDTVGTVLHVAIQKTYAGYIVMADQIKDGVEVTLSSLRKLGLHEMAILTGDRETVAAAVAEQVGIENYYAELLPADKVCVVEKLLRETQPGHSLVFVGDGINDAPVLARADVGMAMGGIGSDAAIEAADVVLMEDNLSKIPMAMMIARRTLRIAQQNIAMALGIKALVLLLAILGLAPMWLAVFADVGVTVLAVVNAMRAFTVKP